MNREQLAHAIRAACQIADIDSVIIVGSQSILGTYDEDELPGAVTASQEVDVLPAVDEPERVELLGDLIEGVGGEMSAFEEMHGFALDGVDLSTSILPEGWRDRLVPVSNNSTYSVITGKQYTGWCLDPADLCVAKLCAGREKDRDYVTALFNAGLVDRDLVATRLTMVSEPNEASAERALAEHFARFPQPSTRAPIEDINRRVAARMVEAMRGDKPAAPARAHEVEEHEL
jgi:hypothetical protein